MMATRLIKDAAAYQWRLKYISNTPLAANMLA
jgi:hypothetical protein